MKMKRGLAREVWVGWVSSLVEAYNMAIYSFMAPILASFLFSGSTAWNALFFSYSLILIASALLYPLGAFYYGFMGDRLGRKKTCVYSSLGLGIATALMGVVPYGGYGWIFFLMCICAQYFFSGGEYQGSIVFSLEHGEKKQKGIMSAFCSLFAVVGLMMANGFASIPTLSEWGIRGCFIAGGVGSLLSYLLKYHCAETPPFAALKWLNKTKAPNWKNILSATSLLGFFIVSYTYIFIFLPLLGQTKSFDTFFSLAAYGIFLVLSGFLSDKWGIEKVVIKGIQFFSLMILPLSFLVSHLLILQMGLTFCASIVIGPIHSLVLDQFEVKNRCRGVFISSAIAFSIFGGSTVPLCLMLFEKFHSVAICSLYPLAIALGALLSLRLGASQVFLRKSSAVG